jgi:hypothetical protein
VQLNTTGVVKGSGTAGTVQVTADKVGAWLHRSDLGAGTFNITGMQLQWNYGLNGLTDVAGLEVRVFAVEMVYVPEGEFNVPPTFYYGQLLAPGNNGSVINNRITPKLDFKYDSSAVFSLRIKGDAGIDTNNDGVLDNATYPTGFKSFYACKYEMSEQQYADFLNTLTASQIGTLGIAGSTITMSGGQYFTSAPNRACAYANPSRVLAFADWSGLRPISFLEFNKCSYGPFKPYKDSWGGYPVWGYNGDLIRWRVANWPLQDVSINTSSSPDSSRQISAAGYYGQVLMTGNAVEPVVRLNYFQFSIQNGDGQISVSGLHDMPGWIEDMIIFIDQIQNGRYGERNGFRFARSIE